MDNKNDFDKMANRPVFSVMKSSCTSTIITKLCVGACILIVQFHILRQQPKKIKQILIATTNINLLFIIHWIAIA